MNVLERFRVSLVTLKSKVSIPKNAGCCQPVGKTELNGWGTVLSLHHSLSSGLLAPILRKLDGGFDSLTDYCLVGFVRILNMGWCLATIFVSIVVLIVGIGWFVDRDIRANHRRWWDR